MGGLAALAREAGHRVTGCDAGVYPPMSDQLRSLGIDLIEGFGADQLGLNPDVWVIGNVVSRARQADGSPRYPLMEAILDAGAALHQRPAMAGRTPVAGPACAGRGRHPRQDHHHVDAGLDPRTRGPAARLPGRRRPDAISAFRRGWARLAPAPRAGLTFRDRGRRIRHGLLRQAQQVRPLPAAHGGVEQPGVRSCRHLRRPRGDRAAVPSSGAHGAVDRARGGQRPGGKPGPGPAHGLLERGPQLRRGRERLCGARANRTVSRSWRAAGRSGGSSGT